MIDTAIDDVINKFNWRREENFLRKTFLFKDFSSATAFFLRVAIISEKLDHHPDILIHSYNKVTISTTTHSENKITFKDIELINNIEQIHGN
jgi:4a-hydroxytetrahydrobiopterin dehydratase